MRAWKKSAIEEFKKYPIFKFTDDFSTWKCGNFVFAQEYIVLHNKEKKYIGKVYRLNLLSDVVTECGY